MQKDQWEVEMWCKVLGKVSGPDGLIYCATGLRLDEMEKLPLTSGYTYTGERDLTLRVLRALQQTLATWQQHLSRAPRPGVIVDGAHAIPVLTS